MVNFPCAENWGLVRNKRKSLHVSFFFYFRILHQFMSLDLGLKKKNKTGYVCKTCVCVCVLPHPGHRQAASSVHYTTSCKHNLVLLRMGEVMARNMLSWLKLFIKLLLLHPVGCLYYCVSDARSHKYQIKHTLSWNNFFRNIPSNTDRDVNLNFSYEMTNKMYSSEYT